MQKDIELLDLFAGVGGFHLGFQQAGYRVNSCFSEVNKHAIAIYKHNFKNSQSLGSVTDIYKLPRRPHIVTLGSPCQDFSQVGERKGLAGNKSHLITEAIRILDINRPDVFIWENVKGVLTRRHIKDFFTVVQAFANLGGYRLEWQLLDTAWFLPQDRERIYLVGHLADRCGQQVFPITDNGQLPGKRTKHQAQAQAGTFNIAPQNAATLTGTANSGGLHRNMNVVSVLKKKRTEEGRKTRSEIMKNEGRDHCPFASQYYALEAANNANTLTSGTIEQIIKPNDKTNLRRLTEIEMERLQGFPDDWTKYGNYDGTTKEVAMTNRYTGLINAVTVDVVQAIATRLLTEK